MPNRWQAIIWTTEALDLWRIYASLSLGHLTHWGWNKMVDMFRQHSQMHSVEWKFIYLFSNSLNCIPKGAIYNKFGLSDSLTSYRWEAFLMGITILIRQHLYFVSRPWSHNFILTSGLGAVFSAQLISWWSAVCGSQVKIYYRWQRDIRLSARWAREAGYWGCFNRKTISPGMGIHVIKDKIDHLIFIMGISLLVRQHICIEQSPEHII